LWDLVLEELIERKQLKPEHKEKPQEVINKLLELGFIESFKSDLSKDLWIRSPNPGFLKVLETLGLGLLQK
jgi:hypothetical protein